MKKIINICLFLTLIFIFKYGILNVGAVGESDYTGGTVELKPPIPETDINVLIGQIIKTVLGVVGSLALLMFVYGGLIWMTSMGSSEKVTKGKNILIWSTLGLVVIFTAYAVISFVLTEVLGAK